MFALSNGLAKFQCSISTETVEVYSEVIYGRIRNRITDLSMNFIVVFVFRSISFDGENAMDCIRSFKNDAKSEQLILIDSDAIPVEESTFSQMIGQNFSVVSPMFLSGNIEKGKKRYVTEGGWNRTINKIEYFPSSLTKLDEKNLTVLVSENQISYIAFVYHY